MDNVSTAENLLYENNKIVGLKSRDGYEIYVNDLLNEMDDNIIIVE